jgi:hypothetical protein
MKYRRTDFPLLASLLILSTLHSLDGYSKDLVIVYKGEVGSFTEVHTRANTPFPIGGGTMMGHGIGEVLVQKEIHQLILMVSLIPSESVVDVYSLKPVGEPRKKAARKAVVACLTNANVEDALNLILRGFQSRVDVPEKIGQQFHEALFECLEPSRPEELTWAVKFHEEITLGNWERDY